MGALTSCEQMIDKTDRKNDATRHLSEVNVRCPITPVTDSVARNAQEELGVQLAQDACVTAGPNALNGVVTSGQSAEKYRHSSAPPRSKPRTQRASGVTTSQFNNLLGQKGAFAPANTLDSSHAFSRTQSPKFMSKSKITSKVASPPASESRKGTIAQEHGIRWGSHVEGPPRKKQKGQQGDHSNVVETPPSEPGLPSISSESSRRSSATALDGKSSPRRRQRKRGETLFGGPNTQARIDKRMDSKSKKPLRPPSPAGIQRQGFEELPNGQTYSIQCLKRTKDDYDCKDELGDDIEEMPDPKAVDHSQFHALRRQKPDQQQSLRLAPAQTMRVIDPGDGFKTFARDSGKLRQRFVRDHAVYELPADDEEDELNGSGLIMAQTGTRAASNAASISKSKSAVALGGESLGSSTTRERAQQDLPPSDIKPSVLTPSRGKARSNVRKLPALDVTEYPLKAYYNTRGTRGPDPSLKLKLEVKEGDPKWRVRSRESILEVDTSEVAKVHCGDMKSTRLHFDGRIRDGFKTVWHHFVFPDTNVQMDFLSHRIHGYFDGTTLQTTNDRRLEKILENAQKGFGDTQDATRKKKKRSPEPSPKQYQKMSESQNGGGQASRSHDPKRKKMRESLRAGSDEPASTEVSGIKYDITPSIQPTETRRSTRKTASKVTALNNKATAEVPSSPVAKKFSEQFGLGSLWQNPLVFPRKGSDKATVDFDDLLKLDEEEFLNDNIVAFCLQYAKALSIKESGRVVIFNTFFYQQLTSNIPKGQSINYEAVKRWTNKTKIFEGGCDHVIVPINESLHWYVAIICNISHLQRHPLGLDDGDEHDLDLEGRPGSSPTNAVELPDSAKAGSSESEGDPKVLNGELAEHTEKMERDNEATPQQQPSHGAQESEKSRKSGGPRAKKRRTPADPVIIVMDSITGTRRHPLLAKKLRNWLKAEAHDKINMDIEEPTVCFEKPRGQDNFSDCGVYLAGYVARFLQDPREFLHLYAERKLDGDENWPGLDAGRMRHNIRDIIRNEYAIQARETPPKGKLKEHEKYEPPPLPSGDTAYRKFLADPPGYEGDGHAEDAQPSVPATADFIPIGDDDDIQSISSSDEASEPRGRRPSSSRNTQSKGNTKTRSRPSTPPLIDYNVYNSPHTKCLPVSNRRIDSKLSNAVGTQSERGDAPASERAVEDPNQNMEIGEPQPYAHQCESDSNDFTEDWYQEIGVDAEAQHDQPDQVTTPPLAAQSSDQRHQYPPSQDIEEIPAPLVHGGEYRTGANSRPESERAVHDTGDSSTKVAANSVPREVQKHDKSREPLYESLYKETQTLELHSAHANEPLTPEMVFEESQDDVSYVRTESSGRNAGQDFGSAQRRLAEDGNILPAHIDKMQKMNFFDQRDLLERPVTRGKGGPEYPQNVDYAHILDSLHLSPSYQSPMTVSPSAMDSTHSTATPTPPKSTSAANDQRPGSAKTHITRRSDRSLRSSLLQTSIRPFGSRLIAPKSESSGFAPELEAPESVFEHCNVRQRNYRNLDVRLYEINERTSLSTRENFIPAQIYDLKTEQNKRHESSAHDSTEILQQIQTHEEQNVISRDFGSRTDVARRRKHIYYFAGGGWQSPPSKEHWKLCAHWAHTLTHDGHPTTVTLVSHPLAPKSRAKDTLPILERLYYEILPSTPPPSLGPTPRQSQDPLVKANGNSTPAAGLPAPNGSSAATERSAAFSSTDEKPAVPTIDTLSTASTLSPSVNTPITPSTHNGTPTLTRTVTRYMKPNDEDIIFAGDSSGGNVALSLVLNVLANNPYAKVPNSLFLISPAVDLRNTNPEILKAEKLDPIMSKRYIDSTGSAWVGNDEDKGRPEYSPLLRDMSILAKRNVVVNGIIGTADVLAPDAQLLMQKCVAQGVAGNWLEWDKQMHCFPLAFSYKVLREANEAVDWAMDRLKGQPER
ncbi:MAG: hypothetical protein Q9162_004367 [Coniocarpon cinnabarinum]